MNSMLEIASRQPAISVIIACYNQTKELELTIASFLRQQLSTDQYELIVVDDHSTSTDARSVVAGFRAQYPEASLLYVRQFRNDGGHYGSSVRAKNIGLRLAQGKFVFFNNAEIVQAGETLAYIIQTMTFSAAPLCLRGVVLDLPFEMLIGRTQAELEVLHNGTDRSRERTATGDHAGLAVIPRDLLLAIGSIDERFDYWGKEDLDLAARLKRCGATYVYDQKLKSFHISHPANHVKELDYLRMCALLEENNSRELIEANKGVLWGAINRPPLQEIDGTIIIEAGIDLDDLGRRLESVIYSDGAERRDVLVVCRDRDRPLIEPFVMSRYRPIELVSLASHSDEVLTEQIMRRVRTKRTEFLKVGSEFAEPAWGLTRAAVFSF